MDRIMWYRRRWIAGFLFGLAFAVPFLATLAATDTCSASPRGASDIVQTPKTHRIVFQVNSDDPATMKHAITNSLNAIKNSSEKE
jgi:hypothetical protein